jgi:hypothetical protein
MPFDAPVTTATLFASLLMFPNVLDTNPVTPEPSSTLTFAP